MQEYRLFNRVVRPVQIGKTQRWLSLAGGSVISLLGLREARRFLGGFTLTLAGGYLIYVALTGRCSLLGAVRAFAGGLREGWKPEGTARTDKSPEEDVVRVSSEESFPASDPPGWTH